MAVLGRRRQGHLVLVLALWSCLPSLSWAQVGQKVEAWEVVDETPRGPIFKAIENSYMEQSDFPFCAWQATTDMSIYTPLLLDPNAVYQPLVLSFVANPHRIYKVSSCFQQSDYFSYQSYTLAGEALESLVDFSIKPTTGKNPFADVTATRETSGTYDIHVTRFGTRGLVNEMRGCRRVPANETEQHDPHKILANVGSIMLRLYSARPPMQLWGNVPPPTVTYSDDDGQTWKEMRFCDDYNRGRFNTALKGLGDSLYHVYDLVASAIPSIAERRCPLVKVPAAAHPAMFPNIQAVSDQDSQQFVAYTNADSAYAFWCTSKDRLPRGHDLILTIEGTAPVIPDGLFNGSKRIADVRSYELRYGSLETAELGIPQPSFASLSFASMADFYGPNWDRHYLVVAAVSQGVAMACGMDPPNSMFLPFSSGLVPTPPNFPAIIYREQLTRDHVLGTQDQTDTVAAVTSKCQKDGTCYNVDYLQAQMGSHYPKLKAYVCNRLTGELKPYDPPAPSSTRNLRSAASSWSATRSAGGGISSSSSSSSTSGEGDGSSDRWQSSGGSSAPAEEASLRDEADSDVEAMIDLNVPW